MADKYLEQLISQFGNSGDIASLLKIQDFHHRKLWHQLTMELQRFLALPDVLNLLDLVEFYTKFISTFSTRLNQLTFVRMVARIPSQIKETDKKIEFFKAISELPKVMQDQEAFIDSRSTLADCLIASGNLAGAKEVLLQVKEKLESTTGLDASVYAAAYHSWASYYQTLNEPENFYKYAIQYVGYTQLDQLPKEKLVGLAFDLGIAALVGETIFNFGDLLEHPVIESLQGTDNQWLAEIIFTFNTGNITKWKELQNQYAAKLNNIPAFLQKHELLDKKIALMSLVDLAFRRASEDRNIPFDFILKTTQVQEVEMLIMRAISLGLLKGTIDEVDQIFSVTWVQPRILNIAQITEMGQRIEMWSAKVKNSMMVMESGLTSDLVS
jgi:26S proteasome regulatory subunit N9